MEKHRHPSPLRYPGGKVCIFPFMASFIRENNLIGDAYAEPYAGGAGLALKLLLQEYVDYIYINDYDPSIYSFWLTILKRPEEFCDWISMVEVTIDNWKKYKDIQNHYTTIGTFELAKSTFFLNRTNISGVIKGGIIGGMDQKGKYKIDARFNRQELIDKILKISKFSDRIIVSNYDGVRFLKELNHKRENIFIYLDPPYVQKGSDLYMNYFTMNDHKKLKDIVKSLNKNWVISYDNHPAILSLYSGYRKVLYKLSQCASNRIGDEVLIFDNALNFDLSLNYLKSPVII